MYSLSGAVYNFHQVHHFSDAISIFPSDICMEKLIDEGDEMIKTKYKEDARKIEHFMITRA